MRPQHPAQTLPADPGKTILLNGASSSGKTTLARQIQAQLIDAPFLILSSDQLVDGGALPPQRSQEHNPGNSFSWPAVLRPRFFSGFHGCIAAMSQAGNNLIVDHIIEYPEWVDELRGLLCGLDVWVVGVHCDVNELERRERQRGNRYIGEARHHLEENRIHELGIDYDFQIDTTQGLQSGDERVQALLGAWRLRDPARTTPSFRLCPVSSDPKPATVPNLTT